MRGDYAVNVCGLLELLVQKSGPFFLSLWSFCLFLHPCFNLRGSLTGRRSGGVWGKWQSLCTLSSCSSCRAIVFLPAMFSEALLLFFFFSLTLLLYQNFRCKLTSDLMCWGIPEVRATRAVKWLLSFWENVDETYFSAVWKIVLKHNLCVLKWKSLRSWGGKHALRR